VGNDKASLWDTAGDDSLEVRPKKATLSRTNDTSVTAQGFKTVSVFSQEGDNDTALLVDAAVGQSGEETLAAASMGDLAQVLWLSQFEKVQVQERSTGKNTEVDAVDKIFAYWQ
jgi:hypothetical protein